MWTLFSWIILLFHVASTEVIQWYSDGRWWYGGYETDSVLSLLLWKKWMKSAGPIVTVKQVLTCPLSQQWSPRMCFHGTQGISHGLLSHRNESCYLLNSGPRNWHGMSSAMFYLSKQSQSPDRSKQESSTPLSMERMLKRKKKKKCGYLSPIYHITSFCSTAPDFHIDIFD